MSGVAHAKQMRGAPPRRNFIGFCNFGKVPARRKKFVTAERIRQHAEHVLYPELLPLISRDLQPMSIGIAEVNRMRDAMVLKVKSDAALFQFLLRAFKIPSIRAQGKMEHTGRVGRT